MQRISQGLRSDHPFHSVRLADALKFEMQSLEVGETETVVVTLSNGDAGSSSPDQKKERMLSSRQTNQFCKEWAKELLGGHNFHAFQLKKTLNEKKHKVRYHLLQG